MSHCIKWPELQIKCSLRYKTRQLTTQIASTELRAMNFPLRKFVGFIYIIFLSTCNNNNNKRIELTHILNFIRFVFYIYDCSMKMYNNKKVYKIYKKSIHHQTKQKKWKIYSLICEMKIEQSNTSLDVSAMGSVCKWCF